MLHVLAERRRTCGICLDLYPGLIRNGSEFDFDPSILSYWSQWLGHAKPRLLIVGQDFGSVGYFTQFQGKDEPNNQTNNNLRSLLEIADVEVTKPPLRDDKAPVFLTNSILCLKTGPMSAPIKERWVRACAGAHLIPLIEQLKPQAVIGMGKYGWLAVRNALKLLDCPQKISHAAGLMWILPPKLRVFAVGHCSGLGLVNRSWSQQVLDWQKIGKVLATFEGA